MADDFNICDTPISAGSGSGYISGRTIDDASIASDISCLNITSSDYGTQITFNATTAQTLTIAADIGVHTAIPEVLIYLAHATAFPTITAQVGGVGDMIIYAPAGATGLEQFGYVALQMNSQAAPYPGGHWRLDLSGAASTGSVVLLQSYNIPVILPPSGNVQTVTGDVHFDAALPEAYTDGGWMYFAANQLKTGSTAGLYWYVGSSTVAGIVYQNTYTPGTNLPSKPTSGTAFTDLTVAAFTGTVSVNVVAYSVSKPANSLGKDGKLKIDAYVRMTNNANIKTFVQKYGSATLMTTTTPAMASAASRGLICEVQNCGNAAVQRGAYSWLGSTYNTPIAVSTVDDASSQLITAEVSKATATDVMVLQHWSVTTEKIN